MPLVINCLVDTVVTDDSLGGTVTFTGFEFIENNGAKNYINAPYDIDYNGLNVVIAEINTNRRKAFRLHDTVYRQIGDLQDALACTGSSGGGGPTTNTLNMVGNSLTSTVNGVAAAALVGQVPVVTNTAPGVTDDSTAGHEEGRLWIDTTGPTAYLLLNNAAGAANWVQLGGGGSVLHNFTATADPVAGDDTLDGYEPGSLWLNTTTGNVFVMSDDTAGAAVWNLLTESDALHNFTAGVDPTVNEDSGDGYEPSSLWLNTASGEIFVLTDDTVGAAVWMSLNAKVLHNLNATVDPVVGDDSADGYEPSSLWHNTTSGETFLLIDDTVGAAVWVNISGGSTLLHNFTATVDPVVGDDDADGYAEGSLWRNTTTGDIFVLADPSTGAAVWEKLTDDDELNNFTATVDPTATDDSTAGYGLESIWYNTTTGSAWLMVDDTVGAAVWLALNGAGRFTYTSTIALITATALGVTFANDDANGIGTMTVPAGSDIYSFVVSGTNVETDGSDDYRIMIDYGGARNHDNDNTDIRYPNLSLVNRAAQSLGGPTIAFPFVMDDDNTPQRQIVDVGNGGTSNVTLRFPGLSATFSDWSVVASF